MYTKSSPYACYTHECSRKLPKCTHSSGHTSGGGRMSTRAADQGIGIAGHVSERSCMGEKLIRQTWLLLSHCLVIFKTRTFSNWTCRTFEKLKKTYSLKFCRKRAVWDNRVSKLPCAELGFSCREKKTGRNEKLVSSQSLLYNLRRDFCNWWHSMSVKAELLPWTQLNSCFPGRDVKRHLSLELSSQGMRCNFVQLFSPARNADVEFSPLRQNCIV